MIETEEVEADEMRLSEFDYYLPSELIAQTPIEPRDSSRLMAVDRVTQDISHDHFFNLATHLRPGDVLVLNDTKVFPARLFGVKKTGGKVEVLIVKVDGKSGVVEIIGKNLGKAREIDFGDGLTGKIVRSGVMDFELSFSELMAKLNSIGYTPLPPYIPPSDVLSEPKIRQRYQTVYARDVGSAAAPTAGFHFTDNLIQKLKGKGIIFEYVTLHVGLGTFLPVKTENIEEHHMHSENFVITQETQNNILRYKKSGKRIIAVGTTSVRVLESDWNNNETNIFIYPGYKFKMVDGMITNFHLPKSTLLMLVCAFAGKNLTMRAYVEAINNKYRFFSFGDAMLVV